MSGKKTYLNLAFGDIMTKDIVTPKSWLLTGFAAKNMGNFNEGWWYFKRKYRDRFLYKHIARKMGKRVSGSGTKLEVIPGALDLYMKAHVPGYASIVNSSMTFPTASQLAMKDMQDTKGSAWNGSVYDDGTLQWTITMARFGRKLSFGLRTDIKKFSYTITDTSDPTNKVETKDVTNAYQNITLIASYLDTSGNNKLFFLDIKSAAAAGLYKESSLEFVPLVPIQENGYRPNRMGATSGPQYEEQRKVEWFMKRLGIDIDEIYKELDKTEKKGKTKAIDNAFIIMGIPARDPYMLPACGTIKTSIAQEYPGKVLKYATPTSGDPDNTSTWVVDCGPITKHGSLQWWAKKNRLRRKKFAKMFYNLIKYYGNGTTFVTFSSLTTSIEIVYKSTIKTGHFIDYHGKQSKKKSHHFWKSGTKITVKKQISDTQYEEIIITTLTERIMISGEQYTLYIDGSWKSSADKNNSGGPGELLPQLWYPEHQYRRLDFMSVIIAREYGTKFLFFAKQVVKTNWWKVIIGIIVIIVLCYFAGCAGAEWVAGALTGMGVTVSAFTAMVIYAVGITAIMMIAQEMISNINSPWARAIAQIILVVAMAYMGGTDALTNPNTYLPLAASVTTILYNTYTQIQMEELMEQRKIRSENESINAKIDNASQGSGLSNVDISSHVSQLQAKSPEALYGQMEQLTNYDQFYAMSEVLEQRTQVVPG